MAFKRQLEADLLAWDPQAGGAAMIAQVMIMGGALRPDFNKREFDLRINRGRGNVLRHAGGMRVMIASLPTLTITVVGTSPCEEFLNPDKLRASLLKRGVKARDINRYLKTKHYQLSREYLERIFAVGKQFMGRRFSEIVTDKPRQRIERMLLDGAVAITADAESRSGTVMLLMSKRSPGKVRAYFPHEGTVLTTLDELHKQGVIDLEHFGATVHAM
jgi:hypothetical protein